MPIPGITNTPEADKSASQPAAVQELLEKNLKWSQIIYEQNRKINRKLLWMAVGSWLRLAIILVPIILGVIYLPPLVRRARCAILGGAGCPQAGTAAGPFGVTPAELIERFLPSLPNSRATPAR